MLLESNTVFLETQISLRASVKLLLHLWTKRKMRFDWSQTKEVQTSAKLGWLAFSGNIVLLFYLNFMF